MRNIEHSLKCLEVYLAILNVILQVNCASISDICHTTAGLEMFHSRVARSICQPDAINKLC